MAFDRMTDDLDIISKYPDEPYEEDGFTAEAFKASFDRGAKLCKAAINRIVDALNGKSTGAKYLGFLRSESVPADNVQDAIDNVQQQIADAYSESAIPAGAVKTANIDGEAVTNEKIKVGDLLTDVTQQVNLWRTAGTSYGENTLKFYYCAALGIVLVRGMLKNVVPEGSVTDVTFSMRGGYKPSSAEGGNTTFEAHAEYSTTAGPVSGNAYCKTDNTTSAPTLMVRFNPSHLDGLESGQDVHVFISGWYFCDGYGA